MPDFPYPLAIPNYDRTTIKGCLESLGIDADKKLEEAKEGLVEGIMNFSYLFDRRDTTVLTDFCFELTGDHDFYFDLTYADVYKIVKYHIDIYKKSYRGCPSTFDGIDLNYCELVKILGFSPDFLFDADYFKNYPDLNDEHFKISINAHPLSKEIFDVLNNDDYNDEYQNHFFASKCKLEYEFKSAPLSFDMGYFLRKALKCYFTFEDVLEKAEATCVQPVGKVLNSITPYKYGFICEWSGLSSVDYERLIELHNDPSNSDVCGQLIDKRKISENPLIVYYLERIQEFTLAPFDDDDDPQAWYNNIINRVAEYNYEHHETDLYVKLASLLTDIQHYGRFLETQQNDTPQITLGF